MNGVLPVDKSEGPTSHDVVAVARRALDMRRIGHTGTLDPFATGLLVLCVGQATKLAQYLTGMDKSYEATARLGVATDTLDRTGEVIAETDAWEALDEARVREAFEGQQGERAQTPPAFSAKRVGGKKSYQLARAGEAVELAAVDVTIHALEVVAIEGPDVRFRLRCSAGTYVRALARDAGEALGVGAHLTVLRRTAVGPFDVEDAVSFDALRAAGEARGRNRESGVESSESRVESPGSRVESPESRGPGTGAGGIEAAFLSPLEALAHLPRLELDEEQLERVRYGQSIEVEGVAEGLMALAVGGELAAVAESNGRYVRPRKVFV